MKVITHGKFSYTKICEDCGCEFEYSKAEIQHKVVSAPFQDFSYVEYDDLYFINCPECGERIIIE